MARRGPGGEYHKQSGSRFSEFSESVHVPEKLHYTGPMVSGTYAIDEAGRKSEWRKA